MSTFSSRAEAASIERVVTFVAVIRLMEYRGPLYFFPFFPPFFFIFIGSARLLNFSRLPLSLSLSFILSSYLKVNDALPSEDFAPSPRKILRDSFSLFISAGTRIVFRHARSCFDKEMYSILPPPPQKKEKNCVKDSKPGYFRSSRCFRT